MMVSARDVTSLFLRLRVYIKKSIVVYTREMCTCSICLNPVKGTRTNPPLRCGHVFHSKCIEQWKEQGKNTCPECRKVFDVSNFKVTLTVENNYNTTSNVLSMNDDMIFNVMDIFDISFDIEDVVDLDALLSDIGSSLSDIDPLVLHTE